MQQKNKFWIYLKYSFIINIRVPESMIFGLFFPLLLTVIFVGGSGNKELAEGFYYIDKYFLIATSLIIIPNAILSIPMGIGYDIYQGFLERLKLFGTNIYLFKTVDLIVSVLIIYIEIIILLLFSYIIFGLNIDSFLNSLIWMVALLPAIISLSLLGTGLIVILKKPNIYLGLGITLLMITLAISGGFGVNPNELGDLISKIAEYIPTYYVINDFYEIWIGNAYNYSSYLLACLVTSLSGIFLILGEYIYQRR